jgi:protein SCO1/2
MKTWRTLWLLMLPLSFALAGCGDGAGNRTKTAGEKEYDVRGKVIAVVAERHTVTLDHEDIPGLMKAMAMKFRVEEPRLLDGIQVGDQVNGRLKKGESGYVLTYLEKGPDR